MSNRKESILQSTLRTRWHLFPLCLAVGLAVGVSWALIEAQLNGTISAGFYYTVLLQIFDKAAAAMLIGALGGALLLIASACIDTAFPTPRRPVLGSTSLVYLFGEAQLGLWPYLLVVSTGLIALVLPPDFIEGWYFLTGIRVLVLLVGIIAMLLILKKLTLGTADPYGPRYRAFLATVLCCAAYFLLGSFFLVVRHYVHQAPLFDLVALGGIFALTSLFIFLLIRHHVLFSTLPASKLRSIVECILPFGFLLLLWVLPALGGSVPANPQNVILLAVDTWRHDHTTLSGKTAYKRDLTPHLRQLAQQGTLFTTAISQAPWTMPAFASIFTGLYPHEHGAISLSGKLNGKQTTLTEILKESGYTTGAVVSHTFVDRNHGFAQGFDYFDESQILGEWPITSEGITDQALGFLQRHQQRPFFLFVHYFDPHYAYRDHDQWDFSDSYSGWQRNQRQEIGHLRSQRHVLNEADIQHLVDLYDEEIAYTDSQIGRLLDYIRRQKLDKNTAIVLVSDHGEEFMERGWIGHTTTLYDEVIHVPLVMALPGVAERVPLVEQTVETRAVFATLLNYLDIPYKAAPANSLLPMIRGAETGNDSAYAFSSVWLPKADPGSGKRVKMLSLRSNTWKLILDLTHQKEMLYNLQQDPDERNNLIESHPDQRGVLSAKLSDWFNAIQAQAADAPHTSPTDAEIKRLKSLGYM